MSRLPPFILFDLDDTILDYSLSGRLCWEELFQEYAPRFKVETDRLRDALRQSSDWYWSDPERHRRGRLDLQSARRDILRMTLASLNVDCPALGDEMADTFTQRREEMVRPFPGAVETLQAFQQRGIRMGLVTNGSAAFQRSKIQRFDLAGYFETILIEGEFGAGKPDRRVFLSALESLEASPSQSWMVGDDLERDIQPAERLGLGTVWVDSGRKGLPDSHSIVPGRVVQAIAELKGLES